ncbi:MAG: hypothetical protein IPQ09_16145 [Myxococcales bacterium]|nr:hypothetical protein [Myxococcales bacterium]
MQHVIVWLPCVVERLRLTPPAGSCGTGTGRAGMTGWITIGGCAGAGCAGAGCAGDETSVGCAGCAFVCCAACAFACAWAVLCCSRRSW